MDGCSPDGYATLMELLQASMRAPALPGPVGHRWFRLCTASRDSSRVQIAIVGAKTVLNLVINPRSNLRRRGAIERFFVKHTEGLIQILGDEVEIPNIGTGIRNMRRSELPSQRTFRRA